MESAWRKNVHITFALLTRLWQVSQSSLHSQGAWRSRTAEPDPPLICCKQATWVSSVSVGGRPGGPPPYTMENKWKPYVTCQQLPRTGAVTSQGSEREAPALWQTSVWLVAEKLSAAQVPGRTDSEPLWHSIYSLLLFLVCVCAQLKFQLAGSKTPVTLRWRLHKPVKNSRAGVSFKSMIHEVNKHNKASQILTGTPPSKNPPPTCLCARKQTVKLEQCWQL